MIKLIKYFFNFVHKKCGAFSRTDCCLLTTVYSTREARGASMLEMMLVIALVLALAPYMYFRISETGRDINDISIARRIADSGGPIMNFVRLNQDLWGPNAQIEIDADELASVLDDKMHLGGGHLPITLSGAFIHKFQTQTGAAFDVYLGFHIENADETRVAKIARNIGGDAGIVQNGTAYGIYGNWGARADIFNDGDLVFRINENILTQDSERFLHRTNLGDEQLNTMLRDLSLGGNIAYGISTVTADNIRGGEIAVLFAEADLVTAREMIFPSGANLDPTNTIFGTIRVVGDIIGFRNITTRRLAGRGATANWARQGTIVADRATVSDAVHVGRNLHVKSSTTRTITGFTSAIAHSIYVPFLATEDLMFAPGFGLTISSELLSATSGAPLKLDTWTFPSINSPRFSVLVLRRFGNTDIGTAAQINQEEFAKIMGDGWQDLRMRGAERMTEIESNE